MKMALRHSFSHSVQHLIHKILLIGEPNSVGGGGKISNDVSIKIIRRAFEIMRSSTK